MKKTISLMLCLLLIFSSVSSVFASPTQWDTTDAANLSSIKYALTNTGNTIYGAVNTIAARMYAGGANVAEWLQDIENHLASALYLQDGGSTRSVTWWLKEAVLDLDAIKSAFDPSLSSSLFNLVNSIHGALTYIDSTSGLLKSWLSDIYQVSAVNLPDIHGLRSDFNSMISTPRLSISADGTMVPQTEASYEWYRALIYRSYDIAAMMRNSYVYEFQHRDQGYNSLQTATNWGNLGNSTFTPLSSIDGTYKWLSAIQTPVARLSYVLASNERINAQQKSAANENAVVNYFIDQNGGGSASVSDFGQVSAMSSGFKSNVTTDASPSGIWNIFNSNNFGWFSQETVNQLDTTTASTRKGSSEFETPLLDQQIEDIYKELGVDVND